MRGKVHSRWRKSLTFALIGCGKAGHSYATIINNHPKTELEAVVDINTDAARAFGASFGCKSYASLDEYLAANSLAECAIVCTFPSDHADIACRLMQRQVNVLCEQPFALDSLSAERMINISRTYGVQLMMGSKFRFVPDIIHARGLIQAGILGHVLEFKGDFRDSTDMRNRWNSQPKLSGGGVLIDKGSAAVDIVRHLFGPIEWIRAEEAQRIQSEDIEDTVRLELRTQSGVMGTIHLSWTLKSTSDDYFRIYGTQGNLCIGWKKSMYRPNGAIDWISFGEGYSTMKALTLQLSNFANCVVEDELPEIDDADELESVRTIETAYQSLQTGQYLNLHPASNTPAAALSERKFSVLSSGKASSTA
ncbi:MAG: Gfo/Idh/MocA family oxidoreductase [Acidobacteria bacterium]|nr:Gfo/Idh/MocA family oxidoreductase [Acidobacteriota bacterium]